MLDFDTLNTHPWPVNLKFKAWVNPAAPRDNARSTRVLVLSKGKHRVIIGPRDAELVIEALERLQGGDAK